MENEDIEFKGSPVMFPGVDLTLWFGIVLMVLLSFALLLTVVLVA
jgi:hypothetical protein